MFFFKKKSKKDTETFAMKKPPSDRPKPLVMIVMDGWGVIENYSGNALSQAKLPNYNYLLEHYPATTIRASGESVGLPWLKEGNSEVGHLNLGLGRVLYQDLPRINHSISDGSFEKNSAFYGAIKHAKSTGGKLHIMGLLSSGGVHSSVEHLQSLLVMAKANEISDVYVHAFLDGRDTPFNSGVGFLRDLLNSLHDFGIGKLASVSGRFYAMDRDNRWDRIEKAYLAMTKGVGNFSENILETLEASYKKKIYDEEFPPTVITSNDKPVAIVEDGDSVIYFNFRPDRARELTKAFVLPGFDRFAREKFLNDVYFVTMTEYEKDLPVEVAFPPEIVKNTLGEVLANNNLKQLRIAETEKYAHVTYFFNGGRESKSLGEVHELVPSPSVESYAMQPEMSAYSVTDKVLEAIDKQLYDFILINYANADMVGHTGNLQATAKAAEAVDECLGRLTQAILKQDGVMIITADHGNAEMKVNMQTGEISKEHTTNPVPLLLVGNKYEGKSIGWPPVVGGDLSIVQPIGVLSDVAPTILKLLNIPRPSEMTGRYLI